MRAVALAVERVGVGPRDQGRVTRVRAGVVVVADEVPAALDARGVRAEQGRVGRLGVGRVGGLVGLDGAGATELGVGVVDAGVDDGDLDALAGEARVLPDLRDAEVGARGGVAAGVDLDGVDGLDVGRLCQRRDVLAGHLDLDAVVGVLHLGQHLAAERLRLVLDGLLLALELVADRGLVAPGELLVGLRLDDGDGVARHLDDHADRLGALRVGDEFAVDAALLGGLLEAVSRRRGCGVGDAERGGEGHHRRSREPLGWFHRGGFPSVGQAHQCAPSVVAEATADRCGCL